MDAELLETLSRITPEERRLRDGEALDRTLYATGQEFEVEAAKLLRQGQMITIRPHTRFVAFPRHSHNYVEIMYVCTGQITHIIGGGTTVHLRAGELLFLNQRASHAIQRADAGDVAVNFIVLPQFFDFAFQIVGTGSLLGRFLLGTLQNGGAEITHLLCHTADLLPVQNLVESMVWSLLNNEPGARRANQMRMAMLLLDLLNHHECVEAQGETGRGSPLVLAALREIEDDCRDASLSRVAEQYHVSLPYLSALIRQVTGSTFKELLQQKRLDRAQQLLRTTNLPVLAVSEAVGYETTSYFYSIYRKAFGITPKEYRDRLCNSDK
ncbi:MAG: AraC family transcriptional regulator [Subdoligranulum variabile]|nr:MAG: AraC family transcriptional regulator [Subdoligranulum variabile]